MQLIFRCAVFLAFDSSLISLIKPAMMHFPSIWEEGGDWGEEKKRVPIASHKNKMQIFGCEMEHRFKIENPME